MARQLAYVDAIREAFEQLLSSDPRVFLIGVGVNSPWYMGSSTRDLDRKFGAHRVIDIPISENCITGMGVGAAMTGMRPIVIHPRMDFMHYAMDPIINHASTAHYMFGGRVSVPLVIRGVINRGGEQAAQHSQALQAMFAHVPGLKVVMPSTPYDAKGLLIAAARDGNPVVYIDDRWLYEETGDVPAGMFEVPIGQAVIRREGVDVTVVSVSYPVTLAMRVAQKLTAEGIEVEVVDLRSVKPLDMETVCSSVAKTNRLLVLDAAWRHCGVAGEVCASVSETAALFGKLKSPIRRLTLPDCHAPASRSLEKAYYLDESRIEQGIRGILSLDV